MLNDSAGGKFIKTFPTFPAQYHAESHQRIPRHVPIKSILDRSPFRVSVDCRLYAPVSMTLPRGPIAGPAPRRHPINLRPLLPTIFVLAVCAVQFHSPLPAPIRRLVGTVKAPFKQLLTMREAEALLAPGLEDAEEDQDVPAWRPVLALIGVVQSVVWPLLLSARWLYTAVNALRHYSAPPPCGLFALFLVCVVSGLLLLAGYIYEHVGEALLPAWGVLLGLSVNVMRASFSPEPPPLPTRLIFYVRSHLPCIPFCAPICIPFRLGIRFFGSNFLGFAPTITLVYFYHSAHACRDAHLQFPHPTRGPRANTRNLYPGSSALSAGAYALAFPFTGGAIASRSCVPLARRFPAARSHGSFIPRLSVLPGCAVAKLQSNSSLPRPERALHFGPIAFVSHLHSFH
ncbi:hypothetical protein C8R44DRAFT_891723 [Mycena epipterygia]|nr:hypothetical protein C8R44DRAFT_891723 [Mycena epipterygia]